MTTLEYICIPNLKGTFDSQLTCKSAINDASVLPYQPVESVDKSAISSRLQPHIDYQSRLQKHIYYQKGLDKTYSTTWDIAKHEISKGHKKSCWMWYVFPVFFPVRQTRQLPELAMKDLKEVRYYIAVDILRTHLIEITQIALKRLSEGTNIIRLFGEVDTPKFWECITLFFLVSINWTLPYPSKQEVDLLNKVCGKVLQVLKPNDFTDLLPYFNGGYTYFNGGYMLHTETVDKVIELDNTINESLTKDTYHQKYVKYKYKYLQYKKTLQ